MLKEKGHPAAVILVGDRERGTEELKLQLSIAERLGVTVEQFGDFIPGGCEVLIDGVFGVGLNRPVTGRYEEFLRFLSGVWPSISHFLSQLVYLFCFLSIS